MKTKKENVFNHGTTAIIIIGFCTLMYLSRGNLVQTISAILPYAFVSSMLLKIVETIVGKEEVTNDTLSKRREVAIKKYYAERQKNTNL